jgi:transposase
MAPQNDHDTEKAARRLEQILAVMRGEKSAAQAAEALGVSRETFYEWNNRALSGLRESLVDRHAGRPLTPPESLEKTQLKQEISKLKEQVKLLEGAILIRDVMEGVPRFTTSPGANDPPSSRSKKKP